MRTRNYERAFNCLPRRLSIVLPTRTIIKFKWDPFFKGDNFVRFMVDTFPRGGSFHTFRLIRPDRSEYAISKRGPHYMGDRLFRYTDPKEAAWAVMFSNFAYLFQQFFRKELLL